MSGWQGQESLFERLELPVAIGTLVVAGLALLISLAGSARSRSVYVTSLRTEWEDLHDHWTASLLLARGSDNYYVEALSEERLAVRRLEDQIEAWAQRDPMDAAGLGDYINELRARTVHVRSVVRFLAYCSNLVLSGRIQPEDAYRLFGPDVSRHGAAIRWMSGMKTEDFASLDSRRRDLSQVVERSYFGEQQTILALIDLLWAETAIRGDNEAHSLIAVAGRKREGTGRICRNRMRRLVWRQSHNPLRVWRLTRRLRYAELIPLRSLMADRSPLVDSIDESLVQHGGIPLIRRLRGRLGVRRWKSGTVSGAWTQSGI